MEFGLMRMSSQGQVMYLLYRITQDSQDWEMGA